MTITTPRQTRHALVLQAIDARVPVVADKRFASDVAGAEKLHRAAAEAAVRSRSITTVGGTPTRSRFSR